VPPGKPKGRGRKITGILLTVFGILPLLLGGALFVKGFINTQQQISNPAFPAVAWHDLPTDQIFPDHLMDSSVDDTTLGWSRQGIAKESSCADAFRADVAKSATDQGCTTALRATYVDISGRVAVTIGLGVTGSYEQATGIANQFDWSTDPGPLVIPVMVDGTPAAHWNENLALAGGASGVGLSTDSPPYFAAISVGPTDGSRSIGKLPGDWAMDGKNEVASYAELAGELVSSYTRDFDDTLEGK
jgi:hypothetical protein